MKFGFIWPGGFRGKEKKKFDIEILVTPMTLTFVSHVA